MIDKEKAISYLEWIRPIKPYTLDRKNVQESIDMAIEALKEQKPHGEWIYHAEWYSDGECAYECSRCGMGSDVDYNFCPNCGADMRKEGEQE